MKLLIKLSIAIVALLVLAIGMLLVLVDPNDYKNEIQEQVQKSINRDLHIKGDIGWTFYPQLGFSSGEIELDNLANFSKPHLLKIEKASLGINILPLLSGEISIGELTIDGFAFTLLTDKNGVSNLDNMGAKQETTQETNTPAQQTPATEESGESFFKMDKAQLAGININNAIIEVEDLQTGSYQQITINEIKLGQFALDKETELAINTKLIIDDINADINLTALVLVNSALSNIQLNQLQVDTLVTADALPNGQLKSQLKTDVNFAVAEKHISLKGFDINTVINADNLPNKKVSTQLNAEIDYLLDSQLATIKALKLNVDQIELAGEMSVQTANITKVRYDLVGNEWDLNPYMAKPAQKKADTSTSETQTTETVATTATESSTATSEEVEPDLSFLKTLDVDGKLTIAGVKVDKIKIGEIKNRLIINNGKAQVKPLTAALYQGMLTVNGEVDESKGRNKYKISTSLDSVEIHQLLIDAAEVDLISGNTGFNFSGKGQGLTPTKIKQGIVGKGNFALLDGELYGVNIPQEIRSLKAKISGKNPPTADAIKKTDFASLTGDFSINKGLVNNQKLLMLSPVMRLDGLGLVDIVKESLDYKLSISPLSNSKEDTDYVDLTGLTIPMLIKGSFTDPKISLDTDSALKEQLKAKLKEETKRIQKQAEEALLKNQGSLDKEKLKKESKRIEDKLKSFF